MREYAIKFEIFDNYFEPVKATSWYSGIIAKHIYFSYLFSHRVFLGKIVCYIDFTERELKQLNSFELHVKKFLSKFFATQWHRSHRQSESVRQKEAIKQAHFEKCGKIEGCAMDSELKILRLRHSSWLRKISCLLMSVFLVKRVMLLWECQLSIIRVPSIPIVFVIEPFYASYNWWDRG